MTIIDLTHEINNQTPVYPGSGDVPPHLEQSTTVDRDGYASWMVTMGMHVGTHIDAPAHMVKDGCTLDKVPLDQLCCRAYVVDARNRSTIDADLIEPITCQPGNALLIVTGFDAYYGEPEYFTSHPVLTQEAIHMIIAKKIGLIGIDTPSPDRFPFTLHKLLSLIIFLLLRISHR